MDNRLPDDTAVAAVVDRWDDSLRARLGPERVVGRTTRAHRRARRDRPAAGVAAGRPGHRRDAGGHRRRRRGAQRGHAPAGRRHPARPAQQLPARVDLPLRRRDPRPDRAAHRAPGCGTSWSTAWPTARSARAGSCRSPGCRSPSTRAAPVGQPDRWATCAGRRAGRSAPGTPSGWRSRSIPACEGGDGYEVPEAASACADRAIGAAGRRPADEVRRRFAEGRGGRAAGGPDRAARNTNPG